VLLARGDRIRGDEEGQVIFPGPVSVCLGIGGASGVEVDEVLPAPTVLMEGESGLHTENGAEVLMRQGLPANAISKLKAGRQRRTEAVPV
jgi:hypothetical protein